MGIFRSLVLDFWIKLTVFHFISYLKFILPFWDTRENCIKIRFYIVVEESFVHLDPIFERTIHFCINII